MLRPRAKRGVRWAVVAALALLAAACVHAPLRAPDPRTPMERALEQQMPQSPDDWRPQAPFPLDWYYGEALLHGFLGAKYLSDFSVESGSGTIELEEDEYEVLPVIGGGVQWKLFGRALDLGVEGLFSFSGRSELEAFVSGSGGALLAFDVDLLLIDLYGGPFASVFLGDRLRLYGSAGPLLQWADYDQFDGADDVDADGSGGGLYARGGLELLLPSASLVGMGARWADSSIDLDAGLGDLELSDLEIFVTYSYGPQPRHSFPRY